MIAVAHGIDLVDLERIEQMLEKHGDHFLNRVFTAREQADAAGMKNRIERLSDGLRPKSAG
jgi:holo-[acyl-carrier protein] synthase